MFLTLMRMIRQPKHYKLSSSYKHEKLKEQAKHFWLRALRVRTGMMKDMLRRALRNQYHSRQNKSTVLGIIRNKRLTAVLEEHEVAPFQFHKPLKNCGIILSRKMLTTLAIYEPRTFKGLVEVSQRAQIENERARFEKLPERRLTAIKPRQKLTSGIH